MIDTSELPIASPQKRLLSFVIDDLVIVFFILAIFYTQLMEIASHLPDNLTSEAITNFQLELNQFSADNLFIFITIKILYHTVTIWHNGMTIGKYVVKLQVVDLGTVQHPTFLKALGRAALRIVSEIVFYLGFLLAFFTPQKQTLHDKLSNCVVVDG
ncbi:MAG: RDD family protein [uncultured Sulfurovum sp.]|uniref:RDD family protein n=1 Tax=uncultured Sulfurovum sp. TaxID=269237 RepID=A0A6S6TMF2_9BACT|nr:MAG: RDD family protein [uncultured Sulfurovum sp.]